MNEANITVSTGTTVWITTRKATGDRIIVLENPNAPEDLRLCEAGRLAAFDGHVGFQPAPFAAWVIGAETLHAIADLIEREAQP